MCAFVNSFFLKKYSDSQCCCKKYSDFGGGKKKSDSEFLSYNLKLNSGAKIPASRDKKNKYSNSRVVRKIFLFKNGRGQPERRTGAHEFRGPQAKREKKRGCTLSKANKIKCVLS
jgi:hypothetical protein